MTDILLITSDFFPQSGGVSNYYSSLMSSYPALKVLTNVPGPTTSGVIRINWSWPMWPRWLPLLWLVPFYKLKTKAKWLAAGQILPIGTVLWLVKLSFGWSYIVFLHGLDIQLTKRNKWKRFLVKQILINAKAIIVNSNFTKELVLKAGADVKKIEVIYPALSVRKASTQLIKELKDKYQLHGKKVILTVSRLVPRKGINQVIEALAQINFTVDSIVYVIVGDGPEAENLKKQSKNLKYQIIFTGIVSDEEKSAWYELCDIFILTPLYDATDVEGFGIVYLEAQAAGKPIIASRVGGVPEAVGQAGLFVNSVADLKEVIVKMIQDTKLYNQLSSKSLEQIDKFSLANMSAKMIKVIKNLKS